MVRAVKQKRKSKTPPIYGIPCTLKSLRTRKAVREVLRQIRERAPEDFKRIKAKVESIAPLTSEEALDGTVGEWKRNPLYDCELAAVKHAAGEISREQYLGGPWMKYDEKEDYPGILHLLEDAAIPEWQQASTAAHEFGHAAATHEDVVRAGAAYDSEWASEATAERYSYKWGFGRLRARSRRYLSFAHHGPARGSFLHYDGYEYRLTRSFRLQVRPLNGSEGLGTAPAKIEEGSKVQFKAKNGVLHTGTVISIKGDKGIRKETRG